MTLTEIAPGVRRLTAPNPSPMTHTGTQSYLVGHDEVAVIDPGPAEAAHLEAVLAAAGGRISHILVTHAHLDHSPGAAALAARTGAPVLGFGPATAGRSAQMEALAAVYDIAGGEGVDHGFAPDRRLAHDEAVESGEWRIEALHTPGHMSNHLCFALPEAGLLFSGDHVMGWSTTMISPPDGNLTEFMASLALLGDRGEVRYLPGHGEPVEDGKAMAGALAKHRRMREAQILRELDKGPARIDEITARLYAELPPALHGAARRNVLAHVLDLVARDMATPEGADPLADPIRRIG